MLASFVSQRNSLEHPFQKKKRGYNIRSPKKRAELWISNKRAQVRSIPGTSSTVAVVPKLLTEGVDEASKGEEMSCAIAIFREAYSSWVNQKTTATNQRRQQQQQQQQQWNIKQDRLGGFWWFWSSTASLFLIKAWDSNNEQLR